MYVVAPQTNVKTHKRKHLSEVRIEGEREERGEKRSVGGDASQHKQNILVKARETRIFSSTISFSRGNPL